MNLEYLDTAITAIDTMLIVVVFAVVFIAIAWLVDLVQTWRQR